jgi:alkaline phosphatase
MAPGQDAPVIQRPSSVNSGESGIEEQDALLTGQRTGKHEDTTTSHNRNKWREIGLFVWAVVASAVVIILAVFYQHNNSQPSSPPDTSKPPSGKRNLIFMVSDGMGPTSLELTRSWRQYTDHLPWNETLEIDKHLIGQSRTRSSSSLVTDSAAGATAFSCGFKSYNGAISVLPDFQPCGSVMEAAKRMGYTTGLVVTTRITDATPAVFASHVRRREMEDEIALQMVGETHPLGRMVDLMMGGGRCHFLPQGTNGSCREDGVDVVAKAGKKGWNYVSSKEEFDHLDGGKKVDLPLLALFAPGDIPYEVDRRHVPDQYPSLEAMAKTALRALADATKDTEQGFFIMIEGSRIDHAGHANDPAAQVHEVLAYDRAMSAVLDFINTSDVPTVMVSTSDHETGGLAAARQLHSPTYPEYLWYPSVLANASHSASYTAREFALHTDSKNTSFIRDLVSNNLGISDLSSDEVQSLVTTPELAPYTFADMISRRAQLGWSTHGHSGADVNIYTSSPTAAKALQGNHENTEVGKFLRDYLGVADEVEKVSELLREWNDGKEGKEVWLGSVPEEGERLDGQSHMHEQGYHGDHRTRRGEGKRCGVCGV